MSEHLSQEPTRLLDDPDLDLDLRHDLELARNSPPVAYSLDAGLARFEQTIHGATTLPPGGSLSGLRVLGWFVGAVALLGGVGYLLLDREDEPESSDAIAQVDRSPDRPEPSGATHEVRTEEEPVAVPRSSDASGGPSGLPTSESVTEAQERDGAGDAGTALVQAEGGSPALDAPAPPRPTSKSQPPKPEPAPSTSLADEAKQINAARKALASDPGKALELMEAAEKQFPDGSMIQERRGYAILALVALGRSSEAEQRADAYLKRWPNGPLSRRVREALGRE